MYTRIPPYYKMQHRSMVVGVPFQADGRLYGTGEPEPAGLTARCRQLLYEQRRLVISPQDAEAPLGARLAEPASESKTGKRSKR